MAHSLSQVFNIWMHRVANVQYSEPPYRERSRLGTTLSQKNHDCRKCSGSSIRGFEMQKNNPKIIKTLTKQVFQGISPADSFSE